MCGECKVCNSARSKKYYQENKERIKARAKEYREDNKKLIMIYNKEYKQENKEKLAAYSKEYYQTPEGKAAKNRGDHKRRAQKNGVLYEAVNSIEIFEKDGWRCQQCHRKVKRDKKTNHSLYPNLDHIVCLANGGEHTRQNTQLLCRECNSKKGAHDSGEQLLLFG
jgi:5-methylcytosine-specific restriction endonuclease McrA